MKIQFNNDTLWPPINPFLRNKMREHSVWYSGDSGLLRQYYSTMVANKSLAPTYDKKFTFWGSPRSDEALTPIHVPIAGDIAETSSDLLFSEDPIITLVNDSRKDNQVSQTAIQKMLDESKFYSKLSEGGESAAAIGGVYLRLVWNAEVSEYPIPIIEQADSAVPEFTFGILSGVHFWDDVTLYILGGKDRGVDRYRLIESYQKDGSILTRLFKGNESKLGVEKPELMADKFPDIESIVTTGAGELLCTYVPNMLPNKYLRQSDIGRSDYAGVERLMDGLDSTFSNWMKDIHLAQARVFGPEDYFRHKKDDGSIDDSFKINESFYIRMDIDPLSEKNKLIMSQFDIRSDQFEKTALNYIERIVTSAGYSPQSFGLNIAGRAESGTALNIRERKSMSTKAKKEKYWRPAIRKIVRLMQVLYAKELSGKDMDLDADINISFSDSLSTDLSETSKALQMLHAAASASVETRVKILNPTWNQKQIEEEAAKIMTEQGIMPTVENPDIKQIDDDKADDEGNTNDLDKDKNII